MGNIRHWRKMTWVLIAWVVLMIIWGASEDSGSGKCKPAPGTDGIVTQCTTFKAGTWLGISAAGFALLGLVWFMTKPSRRICPACGQEVGKGLTQCPSCSHDFAAAATGQAVEVAAPSAPVPAAPAPPPE